MGVSGDALRLAVDVEANSDAAAQVEQITAALAKFRAAARNLGAGIGGAGQEIQQQVNVAIGAFTRLGSTIDVTNARAVVGYAAIGEALAQQLQKLGATDAELNRIVGSISKVQQAAGSAGLGTFIPPTLGPNLSGTTFATRRAADAITSLSFAAQGGKLSMQGLSLGAGAIATEFVALSGATLGVATVVGALVTVGLSLVSVLENVGAKAKDARQSLDEFLRKSATPDVTRALLEETNNAIKKAQAQREALAAAQGAPPPISAFGPGGHPPASLNQLAIQAQDKLIQGLQKQQAALLDELARKGPETAKTLAETQDRLDDETAKSAVQRTQGEFAARRVAAETEFEREEKRLGDLATFEGQQRQAVDAARRHRDEQLRAIDVEETQKAGDLRATAEEKVAKARESAEIAANKSTLDAQEAALQQSLANRAITQVEFIGKRLTAEKAAIEADKNAQLEAARASLAAEQQRLKTVAGPEGAQKRKEAEQTFQADVAKIRADARAKDSAAERDASKETAALAADLAKTVEEANVSVLESQGRFVEAAQAQVKEEFRGAIDTALAEIVSGTAAGLAALVALQARIQEITGAAGVREAQAQRQDVQADLQTRLRLIQAQATSGALSQSEAQQQVVNALERQRSQVESLALRYTTLAAAQPDNQALARDVDDLLAQYIELGNEIDRLKDPFTQLRDAAKGATESSLDQFISGATKLVSQSHVEVNALAGQLANARQELDQLLAIPVNERTSNQTERISELRGEVETLTVSLDNSKQALTSWKSLFLDAAQSIIDALIKVSAQMLATEVIQSSLFSLLFGGGGGFGTDAGTGLSDFFGVFGKHAAGGLISGPGGPRGDRIPILASDGEFIVNAASTAQNRALLETINRGGLDGSFSVRRPPRYFADGGIVTRGPSADALAPARAHIVVEASSDLLIRQIATPKGEQAIVKVVQRNGRAIAGSLPSAPGR